MCWRNYAKLLRKNFVLIQILVTKVQQMSHQILDLCSIVLQVEILKARSVHIHEARQAHLWESGQVGRHNMCSVMLCNVYPYFIHCQIGWLLTRLLTECPQDATPFPNDVCPHPKVAYLQFIWFGILMAEGGQFKEVVNLPVACFPLWSSADHPLTHCRFGVVLLMK